MLVLTMVLSVLVEHGNDLVNLYINRLKIMQHVK